MTYKQTFKRVQRIDKNIQKLCTDLYKLSRMNVNILSKLLSKYDLYDESLDALDLITEMSELCLNIHQDLFGLKLDLEDRDNLEDVDV